ncbi:MAG: PTS glucitol/sorbitol transporter subunit IIB [Micropruina glycogenica]|jgi:glucitol/sorbitol PTS system EIIB component|uniref:Glucitol/sorbitol-specific enzyme IIB component of PTS n=1 Tax=Micropruina glycogenica TaxID=75385 RepID=A0A2N9JMJ3_9ACTN|nr:PTS glucitol/sorbitol transporter subunit IIB [Micropruina glycogenica]SPD88798.1 glucitol/sorbitol-specific enzyme IIB component of PTS [Micropruina glycogenica]
MSETTSTYQTVSIRKGRGGWGAGLTLTPTDEKKIVLSVTGGGIHPVAQRIAELSGAEVVDGFTNHVADDQVLCAVINCGGTARIGVYPRKRIPTVDVYPGEPGGPLAQFITEDIFVSAVTPNEVSVAGDVVQAAPALSEQVNAADSDRAKYEAQKAEAKSAAKDAGGFTKMVVSFGEAIGYFINTLLSSGRQSMKLVLNTIIPFMAYVSLLIGIVTYTGVSKWIANGVTPLVSNPFGLVLLGVITAIPVLSPILGPGAAIAQVVGVLMGQQIAAGALPVQYALPTLFAINGQVGCDFVPVGLSLGEAEPETVSVGVPAVLFSRLITSPVAVILAYLASFAI